MNTIQEKMEKEVITLMFRDRPDLRDQINKARIMSREFTGVGFFTYYNKEDILSKEDIIIDSDVGAILNNSIEVGFLFFIRKEGGRFLECCTYGEPFPEQIESYEAFIYEEDENHMLIRPQ
ncbi:hypothetical protein DW091_19235 [Eubacterium sp. AM05-23]|uniref:hypothetical protein n=1 Tax=Eubacterium TaxID=1730 RepID=UPI000E52EA08|nr:MULTISPECIES: hypothetical protein [Eubacterium]RHO53574.1 hypothetical protein DW091_19235 [Eubacterium sp. AM05-23]